MVVFSRCVRALVISETCPGHVSATGVGCKSQSIVAPIPPKIPRYPWGCVKPTGHSRDRRSSGVGGKIKSEVETHNRKRALRERDKLQMANLFSPLDGEVGGAERAQGDVRKCCLTDLSKSSSNDV